MSDGILVLNTGSSSVKFALYAASDLALLLRGGVDESNGIRLSASGPRAKSFLAAPPPGPGGHAAQIAWILGSVRKHLMDVRLVAAGHRVVHGGACFAGPVRIDSDVLAALETLVTFAPAHQPHNIAGIRAVGEAWPALPQVACFDTAFHRTQPRLAQLFALPRSFADEGLIRYGFHGLSYEHVVDVLPSMVSEASGGRVIAAHLGNGASLCAIHDGRSIATTMGLTALDGLMMGTRCGSLDPGLVLHLIRERGMDADVVADLLGNRSGLLGVSGLSADVRILEASADPRAAEALDLFAYRAACEAGALMAALGGLDVLVFTGGIGEHSPATRQRICDRLAFAGVALDPARNNRGDSRISRDASAVAVHIIPANEELPIARATQRLALAAKPRS